MRYAFLLLSLASAAACAARDADSSAAAGASAAGEPPPPQSPRVVISEVMADPRAVPDERGEWIELYNPGSAPVSVRGWTVASGNDAPHAIAGAITVPARGYVVLARDGARSRNGGVAAAYAYGGGVSLGNGADWVALRNASGRTVDSVAWASMPSGASLGVRDAAAEHADVGGANWAGQTKSFGAGDRGTPGAANDGAGRTAPAAPAAPATIAAAPTLPPAPVSQPPSSDTARAGARSELVVRVLDVGQGDATLITNGGSTVLVDGGPDPARFGRLLDSLGLNGTTVDVVVLSHEHYDHHAGLRELFSTRRNIRVRFFFENKNAYANAALARLRDSVNARVLRGELVYRDTDDPCANGTPVCTITLRGGARLQIMRPLPSSSDPNNRSAPLKLVGPDSASFTMWLAGDAEHEALAWYDAGADYDARPGMRATVLKANHHGSCNGVDRRYLDLVRPEWVVVPVASPNDYGHMHEQAKSAFRAAGRPWYRTDQNGTITIRSPGTPGGGYTITPQRGTRDMTGASDRASTQPACRRTESR